MTKREKAHQEAIGMIKTIFMLLIVWLILAVLNIRPNLGMLLGPLVVAFFYWDSTKDEND